MCLNCIYKRLISINVVLIVVFTMISTTVFADGNESLMLSASGASGEDYIIINGVKYDANEESVGRGWSYHASEKNSRYSENTLLLWGYNGSSIIYSGKSGKVLNIQAIKFSNTITGNNEPGIRCLNGNLEISVYDGNNEDTSFEIKGGANYAGVSLEETESNLKIRSSSRTSSERAIPYISIYGGKNAPGVKAGKAEIKTGYKSNINIYGGTSECAIKVKNTLELGGDGNISLFGSNKSAVVSDFDDSENIIICDEKKYNLMAGNDENDAVNIIEYDGEYCLKCTPKSCNLTIDANGGTFNGNNSVSEELLLTHRTRYDDYTIQNDGSAVILDGAYMIDGDENIYYHNKYVLKRDGYIFSGWYKNKNNENKIENAVNISETVRENEDKDITVYAGWFKADKGDIIIDATNDIGRNLVNLSYHNNNRAARSDGTKYVKLNTDENQYKLPYFLYSGWNEFNSKTQQYEWTIREYEQTFWADRDNLEEKVFTDLNGKEYYLTTKGLYSAGDEVENNNDSIKIFTPYYGEPVGNIIYNLSGMKTYDSGNLIKQNLVTTPQDLCVYTIDDQYIDNPDNKKLIGWSLNSDASTLDYEVGEKIEAKAGDPNINLYAIWAAKDRKDKTVTFSDINENAGLCYAAFYNSKGKQIKTVELKPDADRKVTVTCGYEEYYRIDHINLFTMSPDRFAPVQAVQTAVKNKDGGFDIEI